MNISEVAKKTGLTSKTIRFYEEKGLMTAPNRADNGYRFYGEKHVRGVQQRAERCAVPPYHRDRRGDLDSHGRLLRQ